MHSSICISAVVFILAFIAPGQCLQECDTPIELGFLVDRSGSISRSDFEKVKTFIVNVVAGFNVSTEGTHIGIITYSSNATTIMRFNDFDDPSFDFAKLNETIRNRLVSPSGGGTRVDLALEKANTELFSDPSKYRPFLPKVLLVLTDGAQTRNNNGEDIDLNEATRKLSRKGVEVFVLAVGEKIRIDELLDIAAHKDENLFYAGDFDELDAFSKNLVSSFCKECKRNMDIAFLISTSNSLQDVKSILNAMILVLNIQRYDGTHVGVMTCERQGNIQLKLNEKYLRNDILDTIQSLQPRNSRATLDKCLSEASRSMFDVKGGVRNAVDKYLIVFDDGNSLFKQTAVNDAISTLKNQGVTVIGIAIGNNRAATSSMRTISSPPKTFWFKTVGQREIDNAELFARSLSELICREKPGKCPYFDESQRCDSSKKNECELDTDRASACSGDLICCAQPCGRKCVKPISDCFNPTEIAVLFDTTGTRGSRYEENILRTLKKFLKELLQGFSISQSAARVSLVTCSDEAKRNMKFSEGESFEDVERNINRITLSNRNERNFTDSLRFLKDNVFSLKGGLRKIGRRVLLVFSSGEPTNENFDASNIVRSLTDDEVDIWAVHGGTSTSSYLTEVVPESSHLWTITNLNDEDSKKFQKEFILNVCSTKEGICRTPVCPSDRTSKCSRDYSCPGRSKCCSGACYGCVETKTDCRFPMDLAFIVQNSQTENDFLRVKHFMKEVMTALEIGRTNTYIGIITFNKDANINLEFSESNVIGAKRKEVKLFDAVDKLTRSRDRSTSGVYKAFMLAKERLFTSETGSHPNEIRNVIFITNGKLEQDLITVVRSLRIDISNIFPFFVSDIDDEDVDILERIAQPEGKNNVYLTTSFDGLDQYRNKIAENLCIRGGRLQSAEEPVIVIKGPRGDTGSIGEQGEEGEPGFKGSKGAPGEFGPIGPPGIPGEPGSPGIPGLYGPVGSPGLISIERSGRKGPLIDGLTLRSAEQNFSAVVASEILKNLVPGTRGPKGKKGELGPFGPPGDPGGIGKYGQCGSEGVFGQVGHDGPTGREGSRGIDGRTGSPGLPGEKGEMGDEGNQGRKGEKGPRGEFGRQGTMGDKGDNGDGGDVGIIGEDGPRGKKGERGEPGVDGETGFKGFIGGQGEEGQRGMRGKAGERGRPGPIGFRGTSGFLGVQGAVGLPGTTGQPGEVGDVGSAGMKGKPGKNGKRGPRGPKGKPGDLGDHGVKGMTGFTGVRGESGVMGDIGKDALNGETGEPGVDGINGAQGDSGMTGEKGIGGVNGIPGSKGRLGDIGDTGKPGRRGIDGSPGQKGEIGPDGRQGQPGEMPSESGEKGRHGDRGEKGSRGDIGFHGTRGARGPKGLPGERGMVGFPGTPGSPGFPGTDGYFGPHGAIGYPGLRGIPGLRGVNGLQGRPGPVGEPGAKGINGEKGFRGPPGFPGPPGVAAPPGPFGFPGEPGEDGKKGARGVRGLTGSVGNDGVIGNKGLRGTRGIQGNKGKKGSLGLKGVRGAPGDKGFRGRPGAIGSRGERGSPGPKGLRGMEGDDGARGKKGNRGPRGQIGLTGLGGDKGEVGERGVLGQAGKNGDPGETGSKGTRGKKGVKGGKGVRGDTGVPGDQGQTGLDGFSGAAGLIGDTGLGGNPGPPGPVGSPGIQGLPGEKGPEGDIGEPGLPGLKGNQGYPGSIGSVGASGERGQKGVAGTGTLPGEKGYRGQEGYQGSIGASGVQGVQGEKGEKGDPGPLGSKGEKGIKGVKSETGIGGDDGEKGVRGVKGVKGDQGVTGDTGINGEDGPPGRIGIPGEQGLNGLPGESGKKGQKGLKGNEGIRGPKGSSGNPGSQGQMGDDGPTGENGEASTPGLKGIPGDPGLPGESANGTVGPSGPPGPVGIPGIIGLKGVRGPPGTPGAKGITPRGENGTAGTVGETGLEGNKGVKGDVGKTGINATKGQKGEKGIVGPQVDGVKGDRGPVGLPGPVGAQGEPGAAVRGFKGSQGNAGFKGVRGSQGPPGLPGSVGAQAVSFNGTTIIIYHNETYSEFIPVDVNSNISKRYRKIQENLNLFKKPNGSLLYPAISCAHLFSDYPQFPSGRYWIDPNQGSYEDAEEVYCDFEYNATCIEPSLKKKENNTWFIGSDLIANITNSRKFNSSNDYKWLLQELEVGDSYEFNYTLDYGQLQMLQLHSSLAWQRIIYHCFNSTLSNSNENFFKLQGDDDTEFHHQMPLDETVIMIKDNCKIKGDTWRKTEIEIRAKDPRNLPIRDVGIYDVPNQDEKLGFELGRVCFGP